MTTPGRAIAATFGRHPAPAATAAVVVAAFGASSLARHDARFWAFLVVVSVVTALVALVDQRTRFSRGVMWSLVGLGALHLSGGLLPPVTGPTFYETWLVEGVLKFDQLVHFYGSVVATLVAWQMLGRYVDATYASIAAQAYVAAGFALGKGALNEIIEFALSGAFANVYVGGPLNSEWDLVFDFAGVAAAAAYLRSGAVDRHAY